MQEIQRRHQYSFVKLILRFKRGLHPFYPPSVELVRPHFKGCIAAAVAVHPMLRLGTWDPWRPMEDVIRQIKAFLQVWRKMWGECVGPSHVRDGRGARGASRNGVGLKLTCACLGRRARRCRC